MSPDVDVVVVGAGFAGLYLIHELRRHGYTVRCLEKGDGVGGTWYWNRYPGARCDAESLAYSYSFSPELEQEWQWSERYATQPEILRYAQHVAERFDLYRDIQFEQQVNSATWSESDLCWRISTEQGMELSARFCVLATGCLSVPQRPSIPNIDAFQGRTYQASLWPHEGVDFAGQHVGLIGTGSSGIQAVPVIAEQASRLTVFQRTPNYSVPAANDPLDPEWVAAFKQNYRAHRAHHKAGLSSGFGDLDIEPRDRVAQAESAVPLSDAALADILDPYWERGGARFISAIGDTLLDAASNARVAEYVRERIRRTVNDPITAELLCPTDHPIGSKRICVDTGYYEAFNRDNVHLVDVKSDAIQTITETGLQLASGAQHDFDALVLATGFDAMTGALLNMNIQAGDASLADKWQAGPRTYLGMCLHGFPNLFTVTGPGSPSVLSNMLVSIEQHVDWMVRCLQYMRDAGVQRFEPTLEAEDQWVAHVNEVANATLFPQGGSWYLGANVPGKPRVFMPYAAGVGPYREICEDVEADQYRGITFQ